MTGNEAKIFLEEMYNTVCDPGADPEISKHYFTDDFVHVVDGAVFDRLEFDVHLATLRADLKALSFDFSTVIAEGDRVADVHLFHAVWRDGQKTTTKFIGVYTLRDGKIARFEELSRLIEGAEENRDIGTRIR